MRRLSFIFIALCFVSVFSACSLFLPKDITIVPSTQPVITVMPTQSASQPVVSETQSAETIVTVTNQRISLEFDFGWYEGYYTGEMYNGLPHGQGTFTADEYEDESSWVYDGAWENGHLNGEGSTSWADGFTEMGTYADDYLNGAGSEYYNGVMQYEGNYAFGTFDGYGTMYDWNGEVVYAGMFSQGFRQESAETQAARVDPFKAQCQTLSYTEYLNNPDAHMGDKVTYTGIIYFIYDTSDSIFDFYLTDETDHDSVLVLYRLNEGEDMFAFADGVTATAYGTFGGLYTYETVEGNYVTATMIYAWAVE